MDAIDVPAVTTHFVPDELLAQVVAAHSERQWNMAGMIFDARGAFVARDLTQLGEALRALVWLEPITETGASGIAWRPMPDDHNLRADGVRSQLSGRRGLHPGFGEE